MAGYVPGLPALFPSTHQLHAYDPTRSLRCGCGTHLMPSRYQAHVWARQRYLCL